MMFKTCQHILIGTMIIIGALCSVPKTASALRIGVPGPQSQSGFGITLVGLGAVYKGFESVHSPNADFMFLGSWPTFEFRKRMGPMWGELQIPAVGIIYDLFAAAIGGRPLSAWLGLYAAFPIQHTWYEWSVGISPYFMRVNMGHGLKTGSIVYMLGVRPAVRFSILMFRIKLFADIGGKWGGTTNQHLVLGGGAMIELPFLFYQ